MASNAAPVLDSHEEALGILDVLAACIIAITAVESLMLIVNQTPMFGQPVRLAFVRFGEWLFLPAFAWAAYVSGSLGSRRILPFMGGLATAFLMLTQFRGSWIWAGTFDRADMSKSTWMIPCALGSIAGLVTGFWRSGTPTERRSGLFLVSLGAALVLAAVLPKIWPGDSEFAPTRSIAVGASLISLAVLYYYARKQ